jgi:hypothetical protein
LSAYFGLTHCLLNLSPKGDVFDYLVANGGTPEDGKTAVQLVLDEAQPLGASKGLQERLELMMSGQWKSIDWPWFRTSYMAKALLPGTLTILPGDPGSAKSFHAAGGHVVLASCRAQDRAL